MKKVVATGKKEFKLQWEAIPQEKLIQQAQLKLQQQLSAYRIDAVKSNSQGLF